MFKRSVLNLSQNIIALLFVIAAQATAYELEFFGDARDIETGELLYREIHQISLNDQGRAVLETVEYRAADGQLLGKKTLDYQSLTAPNYTADYLFLDVSERVTLTNNAISIERGELSEIDMPNSAFTIDGGFHYLMLENFDSLYEERPLRFDFLSAGRADFIPMKATPTLKPDVLSISLSLDNFFLSRLVKPIELQYDRISRRLLSYTGLTNLPNAEGKLYNAQITYIYPTQTAQVLDRYMRP